jgi:hypothetical protein
MINKYIKNIDTVNHTYQGQLILPGNYYLIQAQEMTAFENDSALLTDITNSLAQMAKTNDGLNDIADINEQINFLKGIESVTDEDSVPMSRLKLAPLGWHFQTHFFHLTTGTGAIYSQTKDLANIDFITVTRYDNLDQVTVVDADTVKTVFEFEPTHDINILGACAYQKTIPASDLYLWVQAAPHIPAALGGEIDFSIGGMNLSMMNQGKFLHTDGKVSKKVKYDDVNHSGKFEFTFRHDAAVYHRIMIGLDFYKP